MNLYKIELTPISTFSTPIKGDTFFGHLCWSIVYKYGEERLKELLSNYKKAKPFLVVSDAFPVGYFPKPKVPSEFLKENSEKKKENIKKIWLKWEDLKEGNFDKAKNDKEVNKEKRVVTIRNSINYETFTTDSGTFSPYAVEEYYFSKKNIYFLIDEDQLSLSELKEILYLLTDLGYGKDSNIGKGRFSINNFQACKFDFKTTTYLALSPFVLNDEIKRNIEDIFYEPFTRFGKHGGERVFFNPFKKPITMMNSGSVVIFSDNKPRKYIGKAITNLSTSFDDTVHQGYSILLPIKDMKNEGN